MTRSNAHNLHNLTRAEVVFLLAEWGYTEYYAGKIWEQLYRDFIDRLDLFNLQRSDLRALLQQNAALTHLQLSQKVQSNDGLATKYLFSMSDGETVESVLMHYSGRATACISTQAGCAMGCVFCATGQMGFVRHLQPGEIVGQVMRIISELRVQDKRLRNVVLMGMGEPLHNYDATMTAIDIMTDHHGLAIGPRYITLSTVGIPPAIRRIADERHSFNLAVSLHAATDDERRRLVPTGRKWSISDLIGACRYYIDKLDRRVFFEWALISGQNDTPEQANALGMLLQNLNAHVNLIPLNQTTEYYGNPSDKEAATMFQSILAKYGLPSTIRQRRGLDIGAGCGQLRTNFETKAD